MATNDVIRDYICRELQQGAGGTDLADDHPLIESGIIDSMGVMTLLGYLEERFKVQIPAEDLMPENFSSVARIAALVDRHLGR